MYAIKGRVVEQVCDLKLLFANNLGYLVNCEECEFEKDYIFYTKKIENKFTDEVDYFCFVSKQKFELFNELIKKAGVGPKSAFKVIESMPFNELTEAIESGNYLTLTKTGIRPQILRSIVKNGKLKNEDVKYLTKTLSNFGYEKEDIVSVIEQIYDANLGIELLLMKGVKMLNEIRNTR